MSQPGTPLPAGSATNANPGVPAASAPPAAAPATNTQPAAPPLNPNSAAAPPNVQPQVPAAGFLQRNKDAIASLQAIATIVALVVGGFWTYRLFIQQRQDRPRLKIEHKVQHWRISDSQVLLAVDEVLTNTGSVMVDLRGGTIRITQVMPLSPSIAGDAQTMETGTDRAKAVSSIYDPKSWVVLSDTPRKWNSGTLVVEPGESETIPNEFILPARVEVVAIRSYLSNPENPGLGWNGLAYYDLQKQATAQIAAGSIVPAAPPPSTKPNSQPGKP